MEGIVIARMLHVLGVVLWIGGVAMVTMVLLPVTRDLKASRERIMFFETVERRFAVQARVTTMVTGLSGLYLVYQLDLWWRFARIAFWWMHAMVLVWAFFTLVLYVLEPLLLHRWLRKRAARDPDSTLSLVLRVHCVLLVTSLVTIAGAVAGSHGYLLFAR
jgi:uncharacterized membrane protein